MISFGYDNVPAGEPATEHVPHSGRLAPKNRNKKPQKRNHSYGAHPHSSRKSRPSHPCSSEKTSPAKDPPKNKSRDLPPDFPAPQHVSDPKSKSEAGTATEPLPKEPEPPAARSPTNDEKQTITALATKRGSAEDLKEIHGTSKKHKASQDLHEDVPNIDSPNDQLNIDVRELSDTPKFFFRKAPTRPGVVPKQLALIHGPEPLPRVNMVLDLDLTLVEAFLLLDPNVVPILQRDTRVLFFSYSNLQMALVRRPSVRFFLNTISEFADIFVYTHGERTYAETILDKFVDPQRRLIRRDRFCAGEKGEKMYRKKSLERLFPSLADRSRCLIFDDQPSVWEFSDQPKALHSMKFAPLHQHDINIKEANRYYFSCFEDETIQRFTDNELPHVESFASVRSQLKYVAMFLRACYIEAVLCQELQFYKIVQRKMRQVLSGCTVSVEFFFNGYSREIWTEEELARRQYLTLSEKLGASIVAKGGRRKPTHLLYMIRRLNKASQSYPDSYHVHVYFVLHSYFNCTRMPEEDYKLLSGN